MMTFLLGVFYIVVLFAIALFLDAVLSVFGKKYIGYTTIERCTSFWSWVYHSWNFIGPREFKLDGDRTPVRHDGVRWFGHSWEKQIEIPMGELRF